MKTNTFRRMIFRMGLFYLFLACMGSSILAQTGDVKDPQLVSTWTGDVGDGTRAVFVTNNLAYVASGTAGLIILDVSDPFKPVELGRGDTPGVAMSVKVQGKYAYVADYSTGHGPTGAALVIDVSDPTTPRAVASMYGGYSTVSVEVAGNLAITSDTYGYYNFYDISTPTSPNLIWYGAFTGPPQEAQIVGDLAYLADGWGGFLILNIATPSKPVMLGGYGSATFNIYDIWVSHNMAYMFNPMAGLEIYDVGTPDSVVARGLFATKIKIEDIKVVDKLAYLAMSDGIHILDVSDPASPTPVAGYKTAGAPMGLWINNNLLYVADGAGGLVILSLESTPPQPAPLPSLSFARDQQTLLLTTSGLELNKQYHIEASTNMTQWTTWSMFTASTSQVTLRVIPSQNSMRFYRAVQVP